MHLYRLVDSLGGADPKRPPIVFECVGVPGMIDGVIAAAPMGTRVVVVGLCMGEDKLRPPSMAIGKEIDLRFVFGYTPRWSSATPCTCWPTASSTPAADHRHRRTRRCGGGVDALADPEKHAKILIDPRSPPAKEPV